MKHQKHNKIQKPELGFYSRNEWSILGVSCSFISEIVRDIFANIESKGVYIDASHDKSVSLPDFDQFTHHGLGFFESTFSEGFSKVEKHLQFSKYDFALINGNHFEASKQLVFCHPDKLGSLERRVSQLTDIDAFVLLEEEWIIPEFLKSKSETKPILRSKSELIDFLKDKLETPALKALILLGGKSTRMGEDKAEINYHGLPQKRYLRDILGSLIGLENVFYSVATDSEEESDIYIKDTFLDLGPTGGILSAFRRYPSSAWLVIANDIPFMDQSTIKQLIKARNSNKFATSVKGRSQQFMEPLISIYEPRSYRRLLAFLGEGYSCPRKMLINSDIALLEVDDRLIINANKPDDKERILNDLKSD